MSDFIYIATDGNYGDATGLKFVSTDLDLDVLDGESDSEITQFGNDHGSAKIWVVTVEHTGGEGADVSVHATEAEANESLVLNYFDGEELDEDDDLIYQLHLQGLTVQIVSFPIPQTA